MTAQTSKKTAKKAPVKKETKTANAQTETTVKQEVPERVCFFFPRKRTKAFTWDDGGRIIRVVAKNSMIVLRPDNPRDAYAIEKLRAHKSNKANGGNQFVEVDGKRNDPSKVGQKIDTMIEMAHPSLCAMLGNEPEFYRMTKGELIAKALELN